ncbi:alpha-glucan family phosphorylase [Calditrichota bacterium]
MSINRVHTFYVVPKLPPKLDRIREIIYNLHWTWNHEAIDLFRRLDQQLWRDVGQNPVKLLSQLPQERLVEASEDEGFLSHLERVWLDFEVYKNERTWYNSTYQNHGDLRIAYFSAEFGIHECIPIYSGGLGLLAGDHLKAASDLGIPISAVGLMYQKGYFSQYLNADGWQQETYPETNLFHTPIKLLRDPEDKPLEFNLRIGPRDVKVHIWQAVVGRINLHLLDTNVVENDPDDRRITENLYGGDSETRIRQEILLGIGGMKALDVLGIKATAFHMNEGHSAFLALERIRRIMADEDLSFDEAAEAAKAAHVFTTHTPVPAGIDRFSSALIDRYFQDYWPTIGLDRKKFFALGAADGDAKTEFNMAIMAINLSSAVNGVSRLHASVSRKMWHHLWSDFPDYEAPIDAVRNGVHAGSWIAREISFILERYLGPKWMENPRDMHIWNRMRDISGEELWRIRDRMRGRLVTFARRRLRSQLINRGESSTVVERARDVLNMETLTIGFARRFATYKRGNLLFSDPERLKRILTNPDMPVQLIFAGKAHPQDDPGKNVIREIVHFAMDPEVRNKIVFIEDYDIYVARHLVQGCDVWLNTPRVPLEASGTSGMKAAMNGVLNCSTLDGWWADIFEPGIGWAIGGGETYDDLEYQNQVESLALYHLLEKEIVPLFYQRDQAKVAKGWTAMILRMMEVVCPEYMASRMVDEYTTNSYLPCYQKTLKLKADKFKRTKNLVEWKAKVKKSWNEIEIVDVHADRLMELYVGNDLTIKAHVKLGSLKPEDVRVEVFIGKLYGNRQLADGEGYPLEFIETDKSGVSSFRGDTPCSHSGNHGFATRVLPFHEDLNHPLEMGLVVWE